MRKANRTRWTVLCAALYVVALVASDRVRLDQQRSASRAAGSAVSVSIADGQATGAGRVRIAYRDLPPQRPSRAMPILLLHGSPGRKEDFDALAAVLSEEARVIVPDVPGFGESTRHLPDYSFHADAAYITALLDELGVQRVHVLGYSFGGGVALNLVALAPERVASLTMLSAVGVQELELTGDYYANHVVHGTQLAAIWLLQEGTPHFGLLDHSPLDVAYARSFFDSDQRPLRDVLAHVDVPALVIHGIDDPLVPVDAAIEHARLMPQSQFVSLPGGHMLVQSSAALIGDTVQSFVARAEANAAPRRSNAAPARILEAGRPLDVSRLPRVMGIAAMVCGALVAAATALFGLVGTIVAGVFAGQGRLALTTATTSAIVGALVRMTITAPDYTERPFARRLGMAVMRTSLRVWAAAGVMWLLLRVPLAVWHQSYRGVAVGFCVAYLCVQLVEASATHRSRRLWIGRWRRATRWEFWPAWAFYPPVVAYIACLVVKYRSLTLFTAANPSIVGGGVVGESKADILRGLSGAGECVARFTLLPGAAPADEKRQTAMQFMNANDVGFPVVLKPNHGQRGSGVIIVRSSEALDAALNQSGVDTILQEYIAGDEFGLFYVRKPSESAGHIFSITQKVFPRVVGDGKRTLERLILDDERAVCSARLYYERHRDQLRTVPDASVVFPLAELGSHCRGAVFVDGASLWTQELEQRVDAIARSFDGFYFGRFDVRVPGGVDSLRRGDGLRILELNGVTSEATHIYHPGTPLMAAYRVLTEQWRIAFEIGDENRALGARPTSLRELLKLARAYRREARAHLSERPTSVPTSAS